MTTRAAKKRNGYGPQQPVGGRGISTGHEGVAGSKMLEPHPVYVKADNEKVIADNNGSYIVLGRDRPGSRISGYGHEHGSAKVDIVVGRVSADNIGAVNDNGEKLYVDNSFEKDAARIYVSAKANIDDYLNLRPGKVGMSRCRSGIGIKADAVRVVGREGIKLVTRSEPINSQGGTIERVGGIDLIAGNDDRDMQPLVKGNNMREAIENLAAWVGKLNGIVDGLLLEQMQLNTAIALHTHQGALIAPIPIPIQTTPSIELAALAPKVAINQTLHGVVALKSHRINGEFFKANYCKPFGRKYICSRFNNTN
tara:strand:+ start:93 stop:1022 length:930 start_codon:yes stop_codon:yes gene_type:complete